MADVSAAEGASFSQTNSDEFDGAGVAFNRDATVDKVDRAGVVSAGDVDTEALHAGSLARSGDNGSYAILARDNGTDADIRARRT